MKFFSIAFLVLFLLVQSFSQNRASLESVKDETVLDSSKFPTIVGQLMNYSPDLYGDLVVKYTLYVPELRNEVFRKIDVQEDGSFSIKLDHALSYRCLWLSIGEFYTGKLVLSSDLKIEADLTILAKKPIELIGKGIVFSGTDGALTSYVNEYGKFAIPKKIKVNKAKFNTLMNRTAQSSYKEKLIRENYDDLEKIERDFARKKGAVHKWFLESERLTEMHTDLLSIFVGTEVNGKIWNTAMEHQPMAITRTSNQFYDMIAFHVSNPTGNEDREMKRNIYTVDAEDKEEHSKLSTFLREMDKRNAGLSYDNEIYVEGMEIYIKKNERAFQIAKLELLARKFSEIKEGKREMVAFKLLPKELELRATVLPYILPHIKGEWCSTALSKELEADLHRVERMSKLMQSADGNEAESKLGTNADHLASGAGLFISDASSIEHLLTRIKNYFAGNAFIIGVWNIESAASINDMKKSLAMIDRLDDLSVKTVFLCVGDNADEELWKKTLETIYIGGEHVFLSKERSIELMEYLELNTYPTYLFVDSKRNYLPDYIDQLSRIDVKALEARI